MMGMWYLGLEFLYKEGDVVPAMRMGILEYVQIRGCVNEDGIDGIHIRGCSR